MSFNFEITDRFSERVKELRDAIAGMPKIDPVKMDKHFIDAKRYVGAGTVFSAKDIINPDYVFVDPRLNDNAEYIVIDDVGTDIESDFSRLKRSIKECGKMMIKPVEELFNAFFKKKGE